MFRNVQYPKGKVILQNFSYSGSKFPGILSKTKVSLVRASLSIVKLYPRDRSLFETALKNLLFMFRTNS